MEKRKLKCLSVQEKRKLIAEVDKGEKKKKDIAVEYDIPPNTLSTILKNREKILQNANETDTGGRRKRLKSCVYDDVDKAMIKWVTCARDKNVPLSGAIIREKALEFASVLGHKDFASSVGWLDKFKKRHNIVQKAVCGESAAVDR